MSRSSGLPVRKAVIIGAFSAVLIFWTADIAAAQQLNGAPGAGSVPTQVVVEYATIGDVPLSIPILRPDGATAGGGGQTAVNRQIGDRNLTIIDQTGPGNAAALQALGNDNSGRIVQNGADNLAKGSLRGNTIRFDLQQVGNGNQADLTVIGASGLAPETGLAVQQIGNGNVATGTVPAGRDVVVNQLGNGLSADVTQIGAAKSITVQQVRTR